MESRVRGQLDFVSLKKKLSIKVTEGNLSNLRELAGRMKTISRNMFKRKYGNLLGLLKVEVQVAALTALAQYYDPPLRCLTFQDFQLVPTVEEFEHILGLSMKGKVPYRYSDQHISTVTLAGILKVHPAELEGFGETFMDVLALTFYGAMLFPNMENIVDHTAINVFVAYKNHLESPVNVVLADMYGSLNLFHEFKKKKMLCCLPVLYVWFISRINKGISNAEGPVEEVLLNKPEIKGAKDWAQFFASLNGGKIRWCLPWQSRSRIISCGNFPNVPFIGTRSCINYNPVLAQRQYGYPIRGTPSPGALQPIWTHYEEGFSLDLIRQIKCAWEEVMRVEEDPRSWIIKDKMSYSRWIMERVKVIKLPFKSDFSPSEQPQPAESEEVTILKGEIKISKGSNKNI
ncbi:uncharacterized protein LOC114170156 [Vigna unguiculata]|uniref:uncharacterized protein LOC114170156 n=1 Tax=Vigna unguiculata TaxID=3917 RepID=UPI0010171C4E|nr:uncharacterized protein LOC114170156 [Vigna unguiculata]